MDKFSLPVKKADQGLRLDQYLVKNLHLSLSRSGIRRLIDSGKIYVNQKSVKAHYKIKERDQICGCIPEPVCPQARPEEIPLEIVFEDEALLVINKPSGLVTHPAAGNFTHTLVNALLNHSPRLSAVAGPLRPGIVHRLDKDTSGLLVVAKTDRAHQHLARQFREHTVRRKYIALVAGRLEHNEGIIDYPLARDPRDRQKMAVSFLPQSKKALTRYKVIKQFVRSSLLELAAHTGRTHQLRVHLKFLGHPILGDRRYAQGVGFNRLALHATELAFRHPCTGKLLEFHSPPPQCFQDYLISLNDKSLLKF